MRLFRQYYQFKILINIRQSDVIVDMQQVIVIKELLEYKWLKFYQYSN